MKFEITKRFVQYILSSFIFDIPFLMEIKISILRLFFKIGKKSFVSHRTILSAPHRLNKAILHIGNRVGIEHDCDIDYSGGLVIRDNVSIAARAMIVTHEHKIIHVKLRRNQEITFNPLVVEEDAWIGASAIILGSVRRIGKGAIIGAGSVVRKDVQDYQIIMGNPAEVVGKRFDF